MKKRTQILTFWTLLFCMSCEQILLDSPPENTNAENFDILWDVMNERYSLFDYKHIDWDSVRNVYRPLALQAKNDTELYDALAAMLNTLRDGHVNLRTPFDISKYFPYLSEPANYNFNVLEKNYLGEYRITGYLLNQVIDGVGYIHYRSFATPILDSELDFVIDRFRELPGVVIDIRNNEGGDPANGLKIISRMISERTKLYSYQLKNGPGPDDFSEVKDSFLDPDTENPGFNGRIVVLTNRVVYSAGSYFAAYTKALPKVILMGDDTGGGCGVPAGYDLPNGWYFNYSSTIGYTVDGLNFEGGVPVDIRVEMTPEDIAAGRDPILERAITYVKNGN
ncbi:Tricorn protease C1 domain-containing protein [Cyclobacterium xiamenense]|uniref:Tricorn protease C1 domain-containing protein n=1 Tax=Cyclobacterium xiamenense TaxID=1297121 RepID=A0A1H6VRT8_9BACT|nr:S41 family peptidase [Cyclobacterium xiamenense]SEJ02922.1 Tricorn protease C1 domain-containing protein [Cyclobacterium xiamenense]